MKSQRLYFLLLKSFVAAALLVSFSAIGVSAQGGSGRITPNTTTAKKKTTTTTDKKPVTTVKKTTATTTLSRNVKKPVTAAKNFNYYYNRGQTFYNNKDLVNAIASYTQALRLNPNSADAYYNRGLAYYDSKDFYNAINDYTQSIRISPAADAYNNRGLAYQYSGNKNQASSDFRAALRLDPNYARARDNLAKLEGGDTDEDSGDDEGRAGAGSKSETTTTTTDNNSTKNADYYAQVADDQFDAKDFENAIASYTNLIRLSPRNAAAFVRRGFSYHYTGKVEEAYKDYATAVQLSPELKSESYIKCMLDTVEKDNASDVLSNCTKTINEFRSFSLAYYKRGVAYRELNNLASALGDFTRSIELYPKFFNSVIYRGLIYEAQGNNDAAITEYTSAIRIAGVNNPKAYLAYNNRGVIYEKLGNLSQAEADYRKSVSLNPNFKLARDNLAAIQNKQ
jgi:tetratricopeptide (TPR) repeat protein